MDRWNKESYSKEEFLRMRESAMQKLAEMAKRQGYDAPARPAKPASSPEQHAQDLQAPSAPVRQSKPADAAAAVEKPAPEEAAVPEEKPTLSRPAVLQGTAQAEQAVQQNLEEKRFVPPAPEQAPFPQTKPPVSTSAPSSAPDAQDNGFPPSAPQSLDEASAIPAPEFWQDSRPVIAAQQLHDVQSQPVDSFAPRTDPAVDPGFASEQPWPPVSPYHPDGYSAAPAKEPVYHPDAGTPYRSQEDSYLPPPAPLRPPYRKRAFRGGENPKKK